MVSKRSGLFTPFQSKLRLYFIFAADTIELKKETREKKALWDFHVGIFYCDINKSIIKILFYIIMDN